MLDKEIIMLKLTFTLNPNGTVHVRDFDNNDIMIAACLDEITDYIADNVKPDPNFDPDKYTITD